MTDNSPGPTSGQKIFATMVIITALGLIMFMVWAFKPAGAHREPTALESTTSETPRVTVPRTTTPAPTTTTTPAPTTTVRNDDEDDDETTTTSRRPPSTAPTTTRPPRTTTVRTTPPRTTAPAPQVEAPPPVAAAPAPVPAPAPVAPLSNSCQQNGVPGPGEVLCPANPFVSPPQSNPGLSDVGSNGTATAPQG